jgi:predicted ATPase/GAF domain-containing protein/tRNA A-37 threonylcarbamoyl transferase component Bud32
MINIANYQIHTQIYESANSLIYRGIRKKDNQPVILKVLKEDYPTPEELRHYRQEYDITRFLTEVDGVIKAYALEKSQNTLIIILEDFEAESLKILLQQRTFTLEELLALSIRTTEILGQIHRQNIIHKDINPSNLVLNPNTGVLKIIDFGIATQLSKQQLTLKNPEVLEGTLGYMSPEQTGRMNRALDYRSDFYSLGVTCYEFFTGKLPFESTEAMELVHCHIAKTPTPICKVNPDVPPILSELIMKLMRKNAEERYQSAWGIKVDLEKCLKNLISFKNLDGFHFKLAQHDCFEHFQIPEKLYGRESEINTLLAGFERAAAGKSEMMLVAGYSGIGKSVLVKEIYKSLSEKRGYFMSGKFDQFQRNIPYSALVNAFKELVQQLLTEHEQQLSVWKEKLLSALGPNGQLIIDIIPEIEWIIGTQPKVPQLGPSESQNRFKLVFQHFMCVFCQPEHPLVLFLDDLQWVDSATLNLLELILTVEENTGLYLIGAYRDNEVDPTHPLIMTLDKLRQQGVLIHQITLKPLTFNHLNQLIADSLHQDLEAVSSLTDLVMRKTGGNPFFANQFLYTLYEEDLLKLTSFDSNQSGLSRWTWDIAQINALNITDNVVDLMIGKLKKLPDSAQHVLRLAACIGNRFDLETLSVIYEKSVIDTFQDLMPVLTEGLILPMSEPEIIEENTFNESFIIHHSQFLHDRVQQAAYALIDEQQKKAVHLQIGRLLLANSKDLEKTLFNIVNQLNKGHDFITDKTEKMQLAKLNLLAGKKAKASTAYPSALRYFTQATWLLENKSWELDYSFFFELYKELAESQYLNGHFDKAESLFQELLVKAQTKTDKAQIFHLQLTLYVNQGHLWEALKIGNQGLALFNQALPTDSKALEEIKQTELNNIKQNLTRIDELFNQNEMSDPNMKVVMNLLMDMGFPAFISQQALFPIIGLRMVNLSLKYGLCEVSAFGYALYGMIQGAILGNYETGYAFGQLALKLNEKFYNRAIACKLLRLYGAYIDSWKRPLIEGIGYLQKSFQAGIDTGDMIYAGYSLNHIFIRRFMSGEPLSQVAEDTMKGLHFLQRTQDKAILELQKMLLHLVKSLQGLTSHPLSFNSETFNEKTSVAYWKKIHFNTILAYYHVYKLQINFLYNNYQEAQCEAKQAETYLGNMKGNILEVEQIFFYALSLCATDSFAENQVQLNAYLDKMAIWSQHAPDNFQSKYFLLQAEIARLTGKNQQAIDLYEQAIAAAHQSRLIQTEALANELAAKFWLAQNKKRYAQLHLQEARYGYQLWEATAKVADLDIKYPQFISPKTTRAILTEATLSATQIASTSTKSRSEWLDLNSIMKAAQILSGEIVLNQLLEKMMHIVIENAGAQTGFLLLPKLEQWVIQAQGQVDSDEVSVLQSISLENQPIAQTIIQYVARTQESVVLHDASQQEPFTRDPYIVKQRPKSLLCVPLINQGKLIGILYLENHLTSGAFTQERLNVLNLLSSQIAISIENAFLYNYLEQKVAERTQELEQEVIVRKQAEEVAKMANQAKS